MSATIGPDAVPALRPGFRFQWEAAQDAHVLLYPEGMVRLNASAAAIIAQIDSERSVADIAAALQRQFDEPDLLSDVVEFLEQALARGWVLVH